MIKILRQSYVSVLVYFVNFFRKVRSHFFLNARLWVAEVFGFFVCFIFYFFFFGGGVVLQYPMRTLSHVNEGQLIMVNGSFIPLAALSKFVISFTESFSKPVWLISELPQLI